MNTITPAAATDLTIIQVKDVKVNSAGTYDIQIDFDSLTSGQKEYISRIAYEFNVPEYTGQGTFPIQCYRLLVRGGVTENMMCMNHPIQKEYNKGKPTFAFLPIIVFRDVKLFNKLYNLEKIAFGKVIPGNASYVDSIIPDDYCFTIDPITLEDDILLPVCGVSTYKDFAFAQTDKGVVHPITKRKTNVGFVWNTGETDLAPATSPQIAPATITVSKMRRKQKQLRRYAGGMFGGMSSSIMLLLLLLVLLGAINLGEIKNNVMELYKSVRSQFQKK
ncbi:hypothetical protein EB118_12275 [bacterium]|nr:hypothetical protein [bacterium]NDD83471.1 hypothetical protein [bacterium]NDG30834.1 hypothetical protein [bacterium]